MHFYPVVFYKSNGLISGFWWEGGHYFPKDQNYKKIDDHPFALPAQFTGRYYSQDFGRKVKIKYHARSKNLTIHPFPFIKYRLNPITNTIYKVEGEAFIIRLFDDHFIVGDIWNRGILLSRIAKR